jgi:hypothetical protein
MWERDRQAGLAPTGICLAQITGVRLGRCCLGCCGLDCSGLDHFGCLGCCDYRARCVCSCVHHPGSHCSSHFGYDRPTRDSDELGNCSATGNNAAPVDRPLADSNSAVSAGNTALAVSSNGAAASNNPRHLNSRIRHRRNRLALARYRPRNCSSRFLHRNRARTHQETIPIEQSEEFGRAVFDRAWRPPGPRVSYTSDAGERQSIIR